MGRAPGSYVYGKFDNDGALLIPIQLATLNTLAGFFKGELNFTNIEQLRETLKKDSALSGFVDYFFKEEALYFQEPRSLRRNFRGEKDVDIGPDFWSELIFRKGQSPIKRLIDEYCETVDLFWENKNIHEAFRDELIRNPFLFGDFLFYRDRFVEEPPEDRIARIKTDPSLSKVFEEDDRIAKLSGALSILVGYWTSKEMIVKLSKSLDSPDLPYSTRTGLWNLGEFRGHDLLPAPHITQDDLFKSKTLI